MVLIHQKLILLLALIAIAMAFGKLKSGYHLFSSRALGLMKYGLILLIFGATTGLVGAIGIIGPGYSRSIVYFLLESIIGYIGGWSLIIWGMAEWLPYLFSISGRLQKKTKSVKLYEAITRVSSLGDASPATFNKIASEVIESYGYQAASLHIPDKTKALALFSAVGLTPESKKLLTRVNGSLFDKAYTVGEVFQADESIKIHKECIIETEKGPVVDALAMPVDFGTKRLGVFAIYTDHPRIFSQEELQVLDAVSNNLGLAFYRDGLQRSINGQKSFKDLIAIILKSSRSEENLNTRVVRLAKLLRNYLKFQVFNLYICDNGAPHTLDFNLPPASKVIIETGFFGDRYNAPIELVMEKQRTLTLPDEAGLVGRDFLHTQNNRILYVPVMVNGQAVGVLSLTVPSAHQFSLNDSIALEAIAAAISAAMLEEKYKTQSDETFDRIGAIKYSIETALANNPSSLIHRELARILVEKMPATFCRIMLLNDERNSFRTAAIYQRRHLLWDERSIAGLPLSELYTHRKVIATGKPIVISDIDSRLKMSELEARLLLPEGISQCMINPIIIDGKTVGVVTIGENRKAERSQIGSQQIVFGLLLTNVISMTLWQKDQESKHEKLVESNKLTTKRLSNIANQAQTFSMVDGFNSRINGPLAGILASCEYLKSKPRIDRAELDKYLNVINKNAVKIHKLSGHVAEAKRAVETLMISG